MALILAIQPSSAQARALRQALAAAVGADIVVVDSTEAALDAIDSRLPDVILSHAFMSPDEDGRLQAYLRLFPEGNHVQTLCIPLIQPASPHGDSGEEQRSRGRTRRFWLRQAKAQSVVNPLGTDLHAFAADVLEYLSRASSSRDDRTRRPWPSERRRGPRWAPFEVSLTSGIELANGRAQLINIGSGGALIETSTRPDPGAGTPRDAEPTHGSAVTLYAFSGDRIRRSGQPVRCRVRVTGDGRMSYEIAFRFDDPLEFRAESSPAGRTTESERVGEGSPLPPLLAPAPSA